MTPDEKKALMTLIMSVVRYAGDMRWAEVEEMGLLWDSSCPTFSESMDELNQKLSELWKAVTHESSPPKELHLEVPEEEEDE